MALVVQGSAATFIFTSRAPASACVPSNSATSILASRECIYGACLRTIQCTRREGARGEFLCRATWLPSPHASCLPPADFPLDHTLETQRVVLLLSIPLASHESSPLQLQTVGVQVSSSGAPMRSLSRNLRQLKWCDIANFKATPDAAIARHMQGRAP